MKEIQVLSDYKYLGILLSDNCSFKPTALATQAKKLDTLVCPILDYGCEVRIATAGECLEMVHKTFCIYALGLPISATNVACYGELGRPPLTLSNIKPSSKNLNTA